MAQVGMRHIGRDIKTLFFGRLHDLEALFAYPSLTIDLLLKSLDPHLKRVCVGGGEWAKGRGG